VGPAVHLAVHPRPADARDRGPADPYERPPVAAAGRALLPLPVAGHAAGRELAAAAVRPGHEPQPLRRQGGPGAGGRAARLLLLYADALRLAHAGGVLRPIALRQAAVPRPG